MYIILEVQKQKKQHTPINKQFPKIQILSLSPMSRPAATTKMAKQSFKCCLFFERIFEHRIGAEPSEEIKQLFDKYSKNGTMSIQNLHHFMIDYQQEHNATTEDARKIFDSLKHLIKDQQGLNLDAFFLYIRSDLNPPLPPKDQAKVHQDMNAPMSHYYLYTGHNSYLTGNQFCSLSSAKPIIDALEKGVRVIELDLWPKRWKKNEVKVCHGGTLTSRVDFKKCLLAIKEQAFHASKYPVVITFEDHLTPNLQAQVAKMLKQIFGDMLYHPNESEEFPSPNSLKEKVLISTKPPKEYLEIQDDPKAKGHLQKLKSSFKKHVQKADESYSQIGSDVTNKQDDEQDGGDLMEEEDEEKLNNKYRDLIAIHAMKFQDGLAESLSADQTKPRRLSMSEQQLEKAVRAHGAEIVRFTQRNLLRVYPKGTRIDSSNYDPYFGWRHGAQMVAFNMQGTGKHLWIMQGMFRANGGCGYVKKTDYLLKFNPEKDTFDPNQQSQNETTLKVKIYHGEGWHLEFHQTAFDSYSPPDLSAKIGIAGVPNDAEQSGQETERCMNEWVPMWNKEFEFKLHVPELAVLCIEVYDYDKVAADFAGQTCLPVSELRSGIRAVPLHNQKGDQYKHIRLLMHFQFECSQKNGLLHP